MSERTHGRCPECGAAVTVERIRGKPGQALPHGCPVRSCEYPRCQVEGSVRHMTRAAAGEWFCPAHGLLLAAKDLVELYRSEGEANWTQISEFLGETLPELIAKAEQQ